MPAPVTVTRARWLIPAEAPPVADGAVVAAGGRIVRLGPWKTVEPHVSPGDAVEHFPEAAILPGFVNAHTHLGLTDMAGRFRPTANFPSWIGRLTARLMLRSAGAARRAVAEGRDRSRAAGTVAGAEMCHDPDTTGPLDETPGRWTVFGECFRFGEEGLARLGETVAALEARAASGGVAVGLGPHAPYTTGTEVYLAARREADARGWPVTTHLHETEDEMAFTERGEGPFAEWMRRLRILPADWRPPGLRPIPMLAEAGFFAGPAVVAHGNYLTDEDIAVLARSGSTVVYCPRSHAFFGHEHHPWRRLRAAGVNVALGTDSLASCPSLSMLEEMRFLVARAPDADPRAVLAMATVAGARALGLADRFGDLREGLAAEACVVGPLPETEDPLRAVLAGEGRLVRVLGG
jgi:cytosine/adenosine deaminase-related metal-dependent hydrolase